MTAPSTTPSPTPSTKPIIVVASVCRICGQSSGNFWYSVTKTSDGRGSTRSDIPVITQIVGDQQHGRLVGHPEVLQDRPQFLARELVERAEGFVEQQHTRLMDQRAAQIGALKHAAGELPGKTAAEALEADLLQQRIGLVAELGLAEFSKLRAKRLDDLERQHDVPL